MNNISKKINKNENGSALVFVLVMVVVVAITLSSLLTYISAQLSFSKDRVERERAFQIAESGVYYYRWYLAHKISGKTANQIKDFWETGGPYGVGTPYEANYSDPEGGVIGRYKLEVIKPILGSTIVTVKSTGWTLLKPNVKRVVQVRFRRPSWSENSVLANDDMRFGNGTTVTGKLHSNLGVRFDGVATNIVSSSLSKYSDPDHSGSDEFGVHTHVNVPPSTGVNDAQRPLEAPPNPVSKRSDVFQAGRSFPAPQIDFNSVVSDISFMRSQASRKFSNAGKGWSIKLNTDDTMDVCNVNTYDAYSSSNTDGTNGIIDYAGTVLEGSASNNNKPCTVNACCASAACAWIKSSDHNKGKCITMNKYPIPDNGIVFAANNIWLEGTINTRKVSFVAAELTDEPQGGGVAYTGGGKNVFLGTNNLLYTNFDGTDIIGVIAQKNIEILKNSQTNLTIDGAFLAKEGRVGRENYGTGDKKTSITVNGSIATNIRYGFAYVGTSNDCGGGVKINSGYCDRNINFDNNMLYFPPPYFPTGTEYAIDLWDEL
jgi:hypothetical protein